MSSIPLQEAAVLQPPTQLNVSPEMASPLAPRIAGEAAHAPPMVPPLALPVRTALIEPCGSGGSRSGSLSLAPGGGGGVLLPPAYRPESPQLGCNDGFIADGVQSQVDDHGNAQADAVLVLPPPRATPAAAATMVGVSAHVPDLATAEPRRRVFSSPHGLGSSQYTDAAPASAFPMPAEAQLPGREAEAAAMIAAAAEASGSSMPRPLSCTVSPHLQEPVAE